MLSSTVALTALVGSVAVSFAETDRDAAVIDAHAAKRAMFEATPQARLFERMGRATDAYGTALAWGNSPEDSAEQFRWSHTEIFGVAAGDLDWRGPLADGRHLQSVMFQQDTGTYKFTLVYYTQRKDGILVYGADLRNLVRNEPGFPVVLVRSSLRDLGGFQPDLAGAREPARGRNTALAAIPSLTRFTEPELVIWAGVDDMVVDPEVAYTFVADNGLPVNEVAQRWRFVTDAATGAILYQEDLILSIDVAGSVSGLATDLPGADICEEEVFEILPYGLVRIGGTEVFADENGDFVIPNAGADPVTVESELRGEFFRVDNFGGPNTVLSMEVTLPGTADFMHNAANANEFDRAEVNAYLHANVVRDHALRFNPNYPTIATQTNYLINISQNSAQSGGFCPGNAQYQGENMRFCASGPSNPNTAWSSVVYHEYGHHLVAMAGSGQGAYGEGTGDVVSLIILDDPDLAVGFFNNCNSALRDADNICQYSPSGCTTNCGSASHSCGRLLSGCVWSTRNELIATEPEDYQDILSNLAINAILMHSGSGISPAITVHYMTLDDDDATLENGTPHYDEINAGFGAHGMPGPALSLLAFVYPQGRPSFSDPNEGAPIEVEIQSIAGTLDQSIPPTLHVSIDGGAFATSQLTPTGEEAAFTGTLPPAPCFATIDWFISAQTTEGAEPTSPSGAPGETFGTFVITDNINDVLEDFESPIGYAVSGDVSGTLSGEWELGVPAGGGSRGDPAQDFDGSGQCYLTGNAPDNTDVDDGTTILTTPAFDMSGANAEYFVSYARWYSNTFGASPSADVFVVEVSNDDGANWTNLETVGPTGPEADGGWFFVSHNVESVIDTSEQVRFRFLASDLGAGSVIEAAIDALRIDRVECVSVDKTAPAIVHNDGQSTNPFSGYVDSRAESSDGINLDLGVNQLTLRFSEPVRAVGGLDLATDSFDVVATGATQPTVTAVNASANPLIVLTLSGPIPVLEWTTVIAHVEDFSGNVIENAGDLGPGVDESDRVDIGFLPCDVDQSGTVAPFDLLKFRGIINGIDGNPQGEDADFVDIDRNGTTSPFDLLAFRQLINGEGNATRVWADESLAPRP